MITATTLVYFHIRKVLNTALDDLGIDKTEGRNIISQIGLRNALIRAEFREGRDRNEKVDYLYDLIGEKYGLMPATVKGIVYERGQGC